MKTLRFLLILLPSIGWAQQASEEPIFQMVEQNPSFVGGHDALIQFIKQHLQYPELAKKEAIKGKVLVSFVVEKDGAITNAKVSWALGFGCDEEALRVMQLMPKWKPGKQSGKAVRVKYNLPIQFSLE